MSAMSAMRESIDLESARRSSQRNRGRGSKGRIREK